MQRVTHTTKATDLFGAGKHGYTDGVPNVTPATVLNSTAMNPVQEEICSVIEGAGATVDNSSNHQMADAINTLITTSKNEHQILTETQAAQSLKLAFDLSSIATGYVRDVTGKFNALGSMSGFCAVGDLGLIFTRINGGAVSQIAAGSSYTGGFTACTTDSNGVYIAVGANGEVQTSSTGSSFTRRLSTGSDPFNFVITDGTIVVAGGNNGLLYKATTATGTYNSVTSPAGSAHLMGGVYSATSGLWIISTSDGKLWKSSTAASGSWTQVGTTLTGTSPSYLQYRGSEYGGRISFPFIRNTNALGHSYSTDGGVTFSNTGSASGTHGDPFNYDSLMLPNTLIAVDHVAPTTGPMSLGMFTDLFQTPVLSTDCRTLYGVLQSNTDGSVLKLINDQIWLVGHSGTGPFNSYIYISAPIKNKS